MIPWCGWEALGSAAVAVPSNAEKMIANIIFTGNWNLKKDTTVTALFVL
jgi:Cft2 family RNA processing exonuclease